MVLSLLVFVTQAVGADANHAIDVVGYYDCRDEAIYRFEEGYFAEDTLEYVIASLEDCVRPYEAIQAKIARNRALLTTRRHHELADKVYSAEERRDLDMIVRDGRREIARYRMVKAEVEWLACVNSHPGNLDDCYAQ